MSEERQPWQRMDGEPTLWFRRFESYRLMGHGRSLLACVNRERVQKSQPESNMLPGSWKKARDTWKWKARAAAWDQHLIDLATAETEARWRAQIMGPSEALGRLSEQGRVSIGDFITTKLVPLRNEEGEILVGKDGQPIMMETWDINLDTIKTHGHLVKSITATRYGPKIEMHDGQAAIVHMGKHHKLFTDVQEHTGSIEAKLIGDEQHDRAVSTLAAALGSLLSGSAPGGPGDVGPTE